MSGVSLGRPQLFHLPDSDRRFDVCQGVPLPSTLLTGWKHDIQLLSSRIKNAVDASLAHYAIGASAGLPVLYAFGWIPLNVYTAGAVPALFVICKAIVYVFEKCVYRMHQNHILQVAEQQKSPILKLKVVLDTIAFDRLSRAQKKTMRDAYDASLLESIRANVNAYDYDLAAQFANYILDDEKRERALNELNAKPEYDQYLVQKIERLIPVIESRIATFAKGKCWIDYWHLLGDVDSLKKTAKRIQSLTLREDCFFQILLNGYRLESKILSNESRWKSTIGGIAAGIKLIGERKEEYCKKAEKHIIDPGKKEQLLKLLNNASFG